MANLRKGDNYTNVLTATTTTAKSGAGTLKAIIINRAIASSVITIYDNTAASGTKIATITQPAAVLQTTAFLPYDVNFSTGLTVVTSSTDDITIVWN